MSIRVLTVRRSAAPPAATEVAQLSVSAFVANPFVPIAPELTLVSGEGDVGVVLRYGPFFSFGQVYRAARTGTFRLDLDLTFTYDGPTAWVMRYDIAREPNASDFVDYVDTHPVEAEWIDYMNGLTLLASGSDATGGLVTSYTISANSGEAFGPLLRNLGDFSLSYSGTITVYEV